MRKQLSLMLATSMALGGVAVAQQDPVERVEDRAERAAQAAERGVERAEEKIERGAEKTGQAVERGAERVEQKAEQAVAGDERAAQPLAMPPGIVPKNLDEQGDIRNAFEAVTEGALTDDVWDSVVNRLVDADRDRVEKFAEGEPDMKALTDRIAVLKQKWKDKYGVEFDLDEKLVFGQNGYVAIAQGEIANPAQLVGNWPVKAAVGQMAQPAAGRQPGAAPQAKLEEAREIAGGDVNLDKGRNVAIARYPAGHGLPAIDASLIHELPDIWRFDLPDQMTGQKLYANLLAHMNHLGDGSQWPADVNEGYRMVGHHVLAALYDVQPMQAAQKPLAQ